MSVISVTLLGLALWLTVSIPAALLFGRMIRLNAEGDPPARKDSKDSSCDSPVRDLHQGAGAWLDAEAVTTSGRAELSR